MVSFLIDETLKQIYLCILSTGVESDDDLLEVDVTSDSFLKVAVCQQMRRTATEEEAQKFVFDFPNIRGWMHWNKIHDGWGPKLSLWGVLDKKILSCPSEIIINMKDKPPFNAGEKKAYGDIGDYVIYMIIRYMVVVMKPCNVRRIVLVGASNGQFMFTGLHVTAVLDPILRYTDVQLQHLHIECNELQQDHGSFALQEFLEGQNEMKSLKILINGNQVNRTLGHISSSLLNKYVLEDLHVTSCDVTLHGLKKLLCGTHTKGVKCLSITIPLDNMIIEELCNFIKTDKFQVQHLRVFDVTTDTPSLSPHFKSRLLETLRSIQICLTLNYVQVSMNEMV